ncbi:MAG: HlyC/CorC family transporter [Lachnospiraceae bacterium]|uniref:hemolysin family protein n=1 Tax=uncultured Acetatifactor sp. TaxID=1671927 RepID=UPI002611BDD6|nr:hemolysin family protein [uncultured Acetatifactor sp.]MCI8788172.1 HlyC/CorC family transporter [Lachnospiraceae bacterium]
MDDDGPTASIIFYVAMLLIDMFFYGFGAALDSLNEKEIERRAEEDIEGHSRDRKSIRLRAIIGNPAEYLNTVQLITTLINIVIGTVHLRLLLGVLSQGLQLVAENQFQMDKDSAGIVVAVSAVLATFLLLYITLTLGVLLPKKIGARFPEKWAYACITPIYFVTKVLSPFTGLVNLTANGILRIFGLSGNASEADVTEEEIINMVNEGHEQGLIQASEAEMISNIFEFGDKEAQDIMTYRKNILAINEDTLLRDAITFMMEGKNSRYPVYEENIDHIIGILHLKDAMRFHAGEGNLGRPLKELENLMREPVFVHRTKNIDELFRQMQAKKQQMVIVVDEYGQTDGLVAMEDILEEIVGNILDEYDEITEHIEEKGDDEYVIEGKTPLEELEERFGISFDDEEFETLNGFLISRLDKIPEPDEEFDVDYGGFNFRILKVENKMIQSVLVTRLPEAEPALEDSDEK